MRINLIRYSMIVLVIGLVALAAGQADAKNRHRNEIIIESFSWGLSSGQTARINVFQSALSEGSVRALSARIQLLDTEGEVIAQSDEIRVEPGKIRFWDVPRELLPAGEPSGRIQLRARMLITTESFDLDRNRPPLVPTVELIDSGTGRTMSFFAFDGGFRGGVTVGG
jgi:hypothetical protein